jgi:tetraacyldisaccharide 4'-kinase
MLNTIFPNKAPEFWYKKFHPILYPLKIPSYIIGAAILARRCIKKREEIDFPSAGIGSIALGGAGKTTVCLTLAEEIRKKGIKIGIVHSGYGGKKFGIFLLDDKVDSHQISDEVLLYMKNGFLVSAHKNRKKAVEMINKLVDYVLLDDFFSALVEPKLKIVSFTKESLGNFLVQPLGPLREPLISLLWADVVLLEDKLKNSQEEKKIKKYAKKIFYFSVYPDGILHCDGKKIREEKKEVIKGSKAICVSSVAIPSRFERTAEKLGVKIYEHIKFRDHSPITLPQLKDALEKIKSKKADIILTTEKDFWKILSLCEKIHCNIFGVKIRAKIQKAFLEFFT